MGSRLTATRSPFFKISIAFFLLSLACIRGQNGCEYDFHQEKKSGFTSPPNPLNPVILLFKGE